MEISHFLSHLWAVMGAPLVMVSDKCWKE
jgi:hypothetical protein